MQTHCAAGAGRTSHFRGAQSRWRSRAPRRCRPTACEQCSAPGEGTSGERTARRGAGEPSCPQQPQAAAAQAARGRTPNPKNNYAPIKLSSELCGGAPASKAHEFSGRLRGRASPLRAAALTTRASRIAPSSRPIALNQPLSVQQLIPKQPEPAGGAGAPCSAEEV